MQSSGIFINYILKATAFDSIVEIVIDYSLEVFFIAIKYLVLYVVLLQDLFWSSKDYFYRCLKSKYQVLRLGFSIKISVDLVYLLVCYILTPIRLSI